MLRRIAAAAIVLSASPEEGVAVADGARVPVVVELFSSEGCSSCPPADRVLDALDRDQPVAGVDVIALELHVDYWNSLGWSDPFSQAAFSARQRMHDFALHTGTYTPQMVVDGRFDVLGSNGTGARLTIQQAGRLPHVSVKLSRAGDTLHIETGPAPAAEGACHVMLATTERGLQTNVTAGENRGETLVHGPVVRSLRWIGDLSSGGFSQQIQQAPKAGVRVVALVEARDTLHVLGVATID